MLVGEICNHAFDFVTASGADAVNCAPDPIRGTGNYDDAGATLCQELGDRVTEARGGTSDDGSTTFETGHHCNPCKG
jgi:hypothetical protein